MTTFTNRPVSRRELLESGIPARRIEAMRRNGELRTVFRGVYVGPDVEDSLATRADAAALVLGPDQVVCDRAAAFLHGIDAYGARESRARPLETCVRRGGTRTRRHGIDGRQRDLLADDVEARRSVQLTTPLRTALDLGCSLPRHRAIGVMDALARFHGFDPIALDAGSRRFRGRRGVLQLRSLIPLVDPRSESPRESWIRLVILDAGLPSPEVQWWVVEDGVELWRLDLAYPDQKVAVEYDGEEFHLRTEEQRAHDVQRRRWLADRGWVLIVVTKADLRAPEPVWLQRLRDALAPQTRRFRWEAGRNN
jgi:hypothetical protein